MQTKSMSVSDFLNSPTGSRFKKLIGMLGSDGDGERANASAMATKLLKDAGLTWGEVMEKTGPAPGASHSRYTAGGYNTNDRLELIALRNALSAVRRDLSSSEAARKSAESTVKVQLKRLEAARKENRKLKELLTAAEDNVAAAKRAFEVAGTSATEADQFFNKVGTGQRKGLKASSGRPKAFESPLHKQLNELIDEIESELELNDWESSFLTSLRDLKWKISPKQWAKLCDLAEHAGVEPMDYIIDPI